MAKIDGSPLESPWVDAARADMSLAGSVCLLLRAEGGRGVGNNLVAQTEARPPLFGLATPSADVASDLDLTAQSGDFSPHFPRTL